MLSVKEAQERILERISVLDPLELSVTDAHGAVLAETVTAPEDLPPHPSAAIDGFALRSEDTQNASQTPVSLTIIGEAASGRPFAGRLTRGEAVRVFSGAALPEGADCVMRREDVAVVGSSMAIGRVVRAADHIRPAGEDIKRGDPVMQEGQRVRGMDVGVLAAMGRSRVLIRPRPRVVTFSAGDELRDPGQPLGAGLVRDSNSFAIAGMTREAGAEPMRAGIVGNDADSLKEKFQSYLPQADVFITSGGVGEGDESNIRAAAENLGHLNVWQIATSPATTLAFGTVSERTYFGLPSNPVVAVVTFELFVRPALLKMSGRQTLYRPEVEAALDGSVETEPGRESYVRVRAWRDDNNGGWKAKPAGRQGPSVISSVAGANALAVVPGERGGGVPAGQKVRVILLEPLEGW